MRAPRHETLHTKPVDGSTYWSVRTIAAETAISPTSVHRDFKLLGLPPHRSESFFALIDHQQGDPQRLVGSVKQLIKRIDLFVSHYNENCKPFVWTASANSILEKLHRLCSRISETGH
ncbi:transposase [Burkholderia plantarii]|uniref:Transposase n=1 Tax=Burkholderia plantarii TaxID=41899 RepID=A0A0B6S359_BURPL|nr:transposase [Burkholderia plantarii]